MKLNRFYPLPVKCVILLFFFLPTILLANNEEMKMNPYGQYFEDSEGFVAVEAAMLEQENEHGLHNMIMIMSGFAAYEAGIDGKAILYKALPAGKGFELVTTVNGKDFTRFVSKTRWGSWQEIIVNLSGKDIRLTSNEDMAKQIRPLHIRTVFNQPPEEPKKYDINPYGIALASYDGDIGVSMVVFSAENNQGRQDALIMVEGRTAYAEGVDGKVIKYSAVPASGRGTEYQYSKDGTKVTRMIQSSVWGSHGHAWWSIYLDGKNYDLHVVPDESRNIMPLHLLTAYEKNK